MQSLLPTSSVQFQFLLFSFFTVLLGHLLPAVRGFVLQELPLYSSMALFDDNIDYNNNNDDGGSFEVVDKKQEEELTKIEKAIEEVGASSILQPVFPLENGGVGEQAAEKRKHHHHHEPSKHTAADDNVQRSAAEAEQSQHRPAGPIKAGGSSLAAVMAVMAPQQQKLSASLLQIRQGLKMVQRRFLCSKYLLC